MKKEINCHEDSIKLAFFWDTRSFSDHRVRSIRKCLNVWCKAASDLVKKEKMIKDSKHILSINLSVCGDQKMKQLNNQFRHKNKLTDVLSFPLQEDLRCNDYFVTENEIELGDIIICKSVCEKQSKQFEVSFETELIHLLTHGFLHLYGFDHEISELEEQIMESKEKQLIDLYVTLFRKNR